MVPLQRQFGVILVGGGPAGTAVLLAAHKHGKLRDLLQQGLLIVEQGPHIGQGAIGSYAISSDSTGFTFIDPLRAGDEPLLHQVLETPVAQRMAAAGANAVPLTEAGELLHLVGQALHAIVERYPPSVVLTRHTAESIQLHPDGSWELTARDANGKPLTALAKSVILATGASQPQARLQQECVAGMPVTRWSSRLIQSGDVVRAGGMEEIATRLGGIANPRVAVLGGSTSAMSLCNALLNRLPGVQFGEAGVTLLHRHPLHVFYPNPEAALADGYTEFGPGDICPLSNRVFRLSGMRLDSRELLMQIRGIGGRPPEPRMRLHQLRAQDPDAVRIIDSAHLVIAAFGYRPRALRVLDDIGVEVPLLAHSGPQQPMVDDLCRVMNSYGDPIRGLFGIGLAAGFVPRGRLGGEPNFHGQANGLWLWQNDVGAIIVDAVLPPASITSSPQRSIRPASDHSTVDHRDAARHALEAEIGA